MVEAGNGIYLTQDLDFEVDTSGDLRAEFGVDELEKDLAVQSILQLQEVLGRPRANQVRARISSIVKDILNEDPRVDAILSIDVAFPQTDTNTAEVSAFVNTVAGDQELVFEVSG